MKKILLVVFCLTLLVACKKNKNSLNLDEGNATNTKTVLTILNEHSKHAQNFKTTLIRSSASYETDKQSQKFAIDISIEKDKQIMLNIRYIGFPVAKALITPEQVQFYDKWNKVYFKGTFDILTQWIGTELDFNRFQNLLLGQALDSKDKTNNLQSSIAKGLHKIESTIDTDVQSTYYFEDKNGLLKKEEISEPQQNRKVTISYPNYQRIGKYTAPTEINIKAEQEKSINLNIRYEKVTFNEKTNFQYKVPSGYKEIKINQ
ncbi:DUF4292 domain-containing protein [Myroides albus]|uniref:DUF4292 domain-containing protein n=1 Tax=Myroides albus TaxID=2562892 RepID=UPI0021594826|nr:DUF4292 domain-containing protein [Myroides albus]UVD81125.1 DUF4292 domain-containing protein [Myroides albus]